LRWSLPWRKIPVPAILASTDESYAGIRDAVTLFEQRKRPAPLRESQFDASLTEFYRQNQERGEPASAAALVSALKMDVARQVTR
jgi:hypothetical protein